MIRHILPRSRPILLCGTLLLSTSTLLPAIAAAQQPSPSPAPADAKAPSPPDRTPTGTHADTGTKPAPATADHGNSTATAPKDQAIADQQAFFNARLAALHAGLGLDAGQDASWAPVESAIRDLEKTRGRRLDRQQVGELLEKSPSDLLRLRSEQLIRRGNAIKALVDATGPLLDKLDDGQKRRLPFLLEGLRPARVLRAAFDIRFGRVQDDNDDDRADTMDRRDGHDEHGGYGHHHRQDMRGDEGDDSRPGVGYDNDMGRRERQGEHDDDRT